MKTKMDSVYLQMKIKQLAKQTIINSKREIYTLLEILSVMPEKYVDHDLEDELLNFVNSKDGVIK